jgi:hypothetical protein
VKNVTFIGLQERTSGITRGIQISEKLPNSRFIDQRDNHSSVRNSICVLIRWADARTVNSHRLRNCVVGFDLLDRPVQDFYANPTAFSWNNYAKLNVDFFIVNNSNYAKVLSQYTDAHIAVIPHQSLNFEGVAAKFNEKPKVIGYVGLSELPMNAMRVQKFCSDNNITFIVSHPNTREECVSLLSQIDIGVINLNDTFVFDVEQRREFITKYKPNVKLTNFQSFGIPTVANSYDSYLEFGGDAWIKQDDDGAFIESVGELVNDANLRLQLRESSLEVAKKFSVTNVINDYYKPLLSKYGWSE